MARKSWVQRWSQERGWHLVERGEVTPRPVSPMVYGDLPAYVSPTTGKVIEGRKQRERDLKESGCRPYEKGEKEEARRKFQEKDRRLETQIVERLRWVGA